MSRRPRAGRSLGVRSLRRPGATARMKRPSRRAGPRAGACGGERAGPVAPVTRPGQRGGQEGCRGGRERPPRAGARGGRGSGGSPGDPQWSPRLRASGSSVATLPSAPTRGRLCACGASAPWEPSSGSRARPRGPEPEALLAERGADRISAEPRRLRAIVRGPPRIGVKIEPVQVGPAGAAGGAQHPAPEELPALPPDERRQAGLVPVIRRLAPARSERKRGACRDPRRYPARPARLAAARKRVLAPCSMSAIEVNSSSQWLRPPREGTKIMPVGQMAAMYWASCPAPERMRR